MPQFIPTEHSVGGGQQLVISDFVRFIPGCPAPPEFVSLPILWFAIPAYGLVGISQECILLALGMAARPIAPLSPRHPPVQGLRQSLTAIEQLCPGSGGPNERVTPQLILLPLTPACGHLRARTQRRRGTPGALPTETCGCRQATVGGREAAFP